MWDNCVSGTGSKKGKPLAINNNTNQVRLTMLHFRVEEIMNNDERLCSVRA